MPTFVGGSAFSVPSEAVAVTVDSTTTLVTGGALDWIGRPSIKRRSDGALVMVYYRATGHATNDGAIYIKMSADNGATWSTENQNLSAAAVALFPLNPVPQTLSQDAFEPLLWATSTTDEWLLTTWNFDFNTSQSGSWLWRTTDGGETWTAEGGPIAFAGLTGTQNGKTYVTDEDVLDENGVLYGGGRVYNDPDEVPASLIFVSTEDKGVTWTRLATIVSSADLGGLGTQEMGFTYLGSGRFYAVIRDTAAITHTYTSTSSDYGATWSAIADATSTFGITARQRVYQRARLKGQPHWWGDPVLLMTGFVHQTPGTSTSRRNAVWVSRDGGATWDGPNYIDTTSEDGGYSDMFYDADNDRYVVVSYRGTLTAADLKQYVLDIAGI